MSQRNEARAPQLLSSCSRAQEPQLLSPRAATTEACALQQEKPLQRETCALQLESSPCSSQLGKALSQQQRANTAKNA